MAEWVSAFTSSTFARNASLHVDKGVYMSLHDPAVMWYAVTADEDGWAVKQGEDVRVETVGQWTKGMCVVDRRGREMLVEETEGEDGEGEVSGDSGGWLSRCKGNRMGRCGGTPGEGACARLLLERSFGVKSRAVA